MNKIDRSLGLGFLLGLVTPVAPLAIGAGVDDETAPLPLVRVDADDGVIAFVAQHELVDEFLGREAARINDVPLPDGTTVDLELERLDLGRLGLSLVVDGRPTSTRFDESGATVWRGRVVGAPASDVALAFSHLGCHGWIRRGDALFHLVADTGPGGDWTRARMRILSDEAIGSPRPVCAAEELWGDDVEPGVRSTPPPESAGPIVPVYEARVALETDFQYFQIFGDVNAATVYVATLFTWVSARFEEQLGTVLTVPYLAFYTNPADPWTTPDTGGNCIDMIYEFQAAWAGNFPVAADIGYFLSGATLGCGAGFLPGLCEEPNNFSVAGNQNGLTQFPPMPSNANIDFYGATHEIGHNFNAIHTHSYCPPIDECAPSGFFGQCQTQQACTFPGTLMSYCHVCGGFGNIDTYFHPQSAADMRAWVELSGCLPTVCPEPAVYCESQVNSEGCVPSIGTSGHPTLTGDDDFHVTAVDVIANQNGILFYGLAPASVPLGGGTLCVQPPIVRTGVMNSGGSPPPPACDGMFDFHWSQAFTAMEGLTAGTTVYAQFWYRDPNAPSGSGLSDAVEFELCR